MIWSLVAIIAGAILGVFAGLVCRRIVSSSSNQLFYTRIGTVLRAMLFDRDADFFELYKTLIGASFRYVGFQLFGLALFVSPVIVLSLTAGQAFHAWNNSRAEWVDLYPRGEKHDLVVNGVPLQSEIAGKFPLTLLETKEVDLRLPGGEVTIPEPRLNHVVCADDSLSGILLASLGFEVLTVADRMFGDGPKMLILRPWAGDQNFLWPYLSDLELKFLLSMGLFSFLTLFMFRRRSADTSAEKDLSPAISLVDDLLINLAHSASDLFRRLGDFESRMLGKRMTGVSIDRPIFVSGLARSGTTTVLEQLSSIPGVATHQYRDFPFVMTPVIWHAFTSIFSRSGRKQERPHKDGIRVCRESPEAFEEPIWQHFFPHVHDDNAVHTINEQQGTETFSAFFADHIRKIQMIRKGSRYLSKGNYNLTRIRYLADLFPDARFVVPIRHPLEHVWSLVRQNNLFREYAMADKRIADYLRAAGHYEFGPQRKPININAGTGEKVLEAWAAGKDHIGYAIMWAEVYRYIWTLLEARGPVANRLYVLRYEELCARPVEVLQDVINFCELDCGSAVNAAAGRIKQGQSWSDSMPQWIKQEIWSEVSEIASYFGYRQDGML